MKYLIILALVLLTGCASNDYQAYGQAQSAIAQAKASADTARYQALSKIAETGSDASRVAAVMALALGNGSQSQATQIAAPQPSQALQWAQVLAPSLTSIASMHYSSRAAMASAESAARVSESTNAAFVGIAGKIQAPVVTTPVVAAPVLPQANVSTVTTNTTDNHAVSNANPVTTTTTTSANPTTTTLSGSGVIGTGSYVNTPAPVVITPTVTPPVVITPVTTPAPVITPVIQIVPIAQPVAP